jgi:molecular chaperone DnaJ
MSQRKDYYQILGVTDEEKKLHGDEFVKAIKPKYRKLSLENHPDKNHGDKQAEERFKEIVEAWDVLSDEQKRSEYDNPMSQFSFNGDMDTEEMMRRFRQHFANEFNWGMGNHENRVFKGDDIVGNIKVTLEDLLNGSEKSIKFPKKKICHTCHGTGMDSSSREEKCPYCHGTGYITHSNGIMTFSQTCGHCGGTGKVVMNPCKTCGGSGLEDEIVEEKIRIPAGAYDGMKFRMHGKGHESPYQGGIPGDLYFIIHEIPHQTFQRDGNNLIMRVDVNVIDAILGKKVRINTLNGKQLDVVIPQCSEDGSRLILNGYGLPDYNTGNVGKLICVVHIVMPKSLSDKDKKTLEKLSKSESFNKV